MRCAPRTSLAAVMTTLVLAAVLPSQATTIYVPADQPTIQAGIDAASYGDTVLVACGTYYEHDIIMKSGVTLSSETGEADCVTIDAWELGRVIYCLDVDAEASIVGVALTGGRAAGAPPADRGGGLYCENSSPTLKNVAFVENSAADCGGGMHCHSSYALVCSPTLESCVFSGNVSEGMGGGGMSCEVEDGSITLSDCTFSSNTTSGEGGGMFPQYAGLTLTRVTFSGNSAHMGGGLCAWICGGVFTDVTFLNNVSTGSGGGVFCYYGIPGLVDCRFIGNSAGGGGGGICCAFSVPLSLTNVTFDGNSAQGRGGAVGLSLGSNATMTDCTFAGNQADLGGGVSCWEASPTLSRVTFSANAATNGAGLYCDDSSPTLDNCILAFGLDGEAVCHDGIGSATLTCCDVYGNAGGDWVGCIADQCGVNGNISEDPLFCRELNPDEPYTLHANSPCAPENNPECGLIGAWGVGCGLTPVQAASWGAIKAMFR